MNIIRKLYAESKADKSMFVLFAKRNLYAKAGKGRFC